MPLAANRAEASIGTVWSSTPWMIKVGKRADINVLDYANLNLGRPEMHFDLPSGAPRIHQGSTGYVATLVNGVATRRNDQDTGARPGRVYRSRAN